MFRFSLARSCGLAAAVLVASACSGDDVDTSSTSFTAAPSTGAAPASNSTTPGAATNEAVRVVEVSYGGGQVAGGAQRTTVRVGEKVRIVVTSDVADEVHVHTYDLRAAVAPGRPAQVELVASIPGRHEVELEKKRRQLLVLEVR